MSAYPNFDVHVVVFVCVCLCTNTECGELLMKVDLESRWPETSMCSDSNSI